MPTRDRRLWVHGLIDRETYKERRSAALAEWQILAS